MGRSRSLNTRLGRPSTTLLGDRRQLSRLERLSSFAPTETHSSYARYKAPINRTFSTNNDRDTNTSSKRLDRTGNSSGKEIDESAESAKKAVVPVPASDTSDADEKKQLSLWVRFKNELRHYYNGSRLFYLQSKKAFQIVRKLLNGQSISRRERRLLKRAMADMFRVVPFSIMMIIPFMEFAIPFLVRIFPNMLPSTFQSELAARESIRKQVAAKVDVAKFLQETVYDDTIVRRAYTKEQREEFNKFIKELRSGAHVPPVQRVLEFARLFKDDFTLDNLSRHQLEGMCRLLLMKPYGTDGFLRWQLQRHMRKLKEDDREIIEEGGVDALSAEDLEAACRDRGMRSVYRTQSYRHRHLREQLANWLELSVQKKIPMTLLLLTRAFMITQQNLEEALSTTVQSALPELVLGEAQVNLAIDKHVRRQLQLEVTEREMELIAAEEEQTKATESAIQLEESREESLKSLESVADAIMAAASSNDVLADELEKIESLKEHMKDRDEEQALSSTAVMGAVAAAADVLDTEGLEKVAKLAAANSEKMSEADVLSVLEVAGRDPSLVEKEARRRLERESKPQQTESEKRSEAYRSRPSVYSDASESAAPTPLDSEEARAKVAQEEKVAKTAAETRVDRMINDLEAEVKNQELLVKQMTKIIDEDNDGVVTKEEARKAALLLVDGLSETEIDKVMEQLDADHDGKISISDLHNIIDDFEERLEKAEDKVKERLQQASEEQSQKKKEESKE